MEQGLYHPNCKDGHTTYFPGISEEPERLTRKSIEKSVAAYKDEQRMRYAQRQAEKYKNLADNSLDEENKKKYRILQNKWNNELIRIKDKVTRRTEKKVLDFKNSLKDISNNDVKTLLKQSAERTRFNVSTRRQSYFDGKEIYLTKNAQNDTIAHELFHEIDYSYRLTGDGMLSDSVRNDYERIRNSARIYGKPIEEMLYSKYPKAFYIDQRGKLKMNEQYRGISDILNGMSKGNIKLGFGHGSKGYWDKPLALEKETFAQYGRMLYNQDKLVLKMAKEIFPETNSEIMGTLKRMVK